MELTYKRATLADLEMLTETRVLVLRAANKLPNDVDMTDVKSQSYKYYKEALSNDTHVAYLVFDGPGFVGGRSEGAGSTCYFFGSNGYGKALI